MKGLVSILIAVVGTVLVWFGATFYGPKVEAQELPVRCSVPMEYGRLVTVFEGDWGRTPDVDIGVFEDSQGTIRKVRLECEVTTRDYTGESNYTTNGFPEMQR